METLPEEPQPQPQTRPGRARLTNPETLAREEEPPVVAQQPGATDPGPPADVHEPTARAHRARLSDEVRDKAQAEAAAQPGAQPDPAKLAQVVAELRARQSFLTAAVGGVIAAVAGGLIWALITVATDYQIGWMAVGVGLLVGGTVRGLGRGLDRSFGYLGAGMSLLGCLLGNYLSVCMGIASREGLSPLTVVMHINPAMIPSMLIATFHPMDLLFYAIAVYEGYRFSFRRLRGAEVGRVAVQN